MAVFFLALASAFFVAMNQVLIRKGLDSTSRTQAILISLFVSAFIFLIANTLLGNFPLFFVPAAGLFMLVGLLGPGLGRTLNITSLKRIGVSRTTPVVGTAPFFATILAILFLDEGYSFYLFLGMGLIVLGIFILSRRKENGKHVFDKKDLLLPLSSAFLGGSSIVVAKIALGALGNPFVGVGITLGTAFFVVLGYTLGTRQIKKLNFTRVEATFPVLAGCSMAAAFFLNFKALEIGDVAVVAPIFSAFPLFGVFLSHFILKEQITARIWLAAIIIVLGVGLIQVF
jgi:LPXTG-motif cell wall-anchored protein